MNSGLARARVPYIWDTDPRTCHLETVQVYMIKVSSISVSVFIFFCSEYFDLGNMFLDNENI